VSHEIDESTGKPAIAYAGKKPWQFMIYDVRA
jgi:hypothetical protein